MKVYIVTSNNIEDAYPEAVFYTQEEAQSYIDVNFGLVNDGKRVYSFIVEHRVRHYPHD